MSETPPQLRVGDRERRAVDEQLQSAVGDGVLTLSEYDERSALLWQARTRADLDELVADLPGPAHAPTPLPAVRGDAKPRRAVGVMSEERLTGPVAPGQQVQGWALMGSAKLDLRRDDLPDRVDVQVRSVMGDVEVLVPPGASVHLSGFSVMGDRRSDVGEGPGPEVHVDAIAVMGSVKVSHGDGTVVRTGRPAAVPAPRPSSVALPRTHDLHRSGGRHQVARLLSRGKALAVPALVLGAVLLAGPDNATIFGNNVERVTDEAEQVQVSRLFGNLTVIVPDDRQVDPSNLALFGNVECEQACSNDGEVLEVRTFGAFGNVEILTQRERAAQLAEERREDAEEEREERLEDEREDAED
jgi:Domain of unknown function (DUF1707)/Cell wall-active antibiotics response 4TMS YvqF